MRAKKLGRHELLGWINGITQSDYPKIENLSDGVGFIQLYDAFYPNMASLISIKFNSKNPEDWEKNFSILNETLGKIKSFKQIDPSKMAQGKFSINFEFLQFSYDFFAKNFGDPTIKYLAYEKRLEIINRQNNSKVTDVKKYLPTHLIPNELILKMDKQKLFGSQSNEDIVDYNKNDSPKQKMPNHFNSIVEKYKDFYSILKDDLKKMVENNISLNTEINDIEEEQIYYLEKLNVVLNFAENKLNSNKIKNETKQMLEDVVKIIKHVPEDFK